MLTFEFFGLACFSFQIGVNLVTVGVVVGESCVNLRQGEMTELPHDFFRNEPHVVPLGDPANRDACAGDAGPPASNIGLPGDEATDLGHGWHTASIALACLYRAKTTKKISAL